VAASCVRLSQCHCQHALGDCTIKFESNSFRILLSAGYNNFEGFDAVSSLRSKSKSKVRRHQTLAKLVSSLHYCAYATGCTENRGLLTEQALPQSVCTRRSKSLLPEQAFLEQKETLTADCASRLYSCRQKPAYGNGTETLEQQKP